MGELRGADLGGGGREKGELEIITIRIALLLFVRLRLFLANALLGMDGGREE